MKVKGSMPVHHSAPPPSPPMQQQRPVEWLGSYLWARRPSNSSEAIPTDRLYFLPPCVSGNNDSSFDSSTGSGLTPSGLIRETHRKPTTLKELPTLKHNSMQPGKSDYVYTKQNKGADIKEPSPKPIDRPRFHWPRSMMGLSVCLLELENQWKPMENQWKPMENNGNQGKPMETNGKPRETNGNQWNEMATKGNQWKLMENNGKKTTKGNQWKTMERKGNQGKPMENNGTKGQPRGTNGKQWNEKATKGNRWKPMENNGNPWKTMATEGNQCKTIEDNGSQPSNILVSLSLLKEYQLQDARLNHFTSHLSGR